LFIIEIFRFATNTNPLPIKEITSLLMVLQLLVAPAVAYYTLDNSNNSMQVTDVIYFKFIIPAYLAFLCGLYIPVWKKKQKFPKLESIVSSKNKGIGITMLITSVFSLVLIRFVPDSLSFIVVLLINLRFVGVLYIFFSTYKYRYLVILILYTIFAFQIIASGIFIDLFIWSFFIFSLFAYKYGFSNRIKLITISIAFFLAFLLQSFKAEFRDEIASPNMSSSEVGTFFSMGYDKVKNINELFSLENYNKFVLRINQGWILSYILDRIPAKVAFTNGSYFFQEVKGIIFPRFIISDKAKVGSHDKFYYFTGLQLSEGTTMNVGIFGDGYGNFGYNGNLIFSFLFGLAVNYAISVAYKLSKKYSTILMWLPFIFFYVMRAGNEFYIIANWIVKSAVFVWIIYFLFKKYFKVAPQQSNTVTINA
jgi:hypothetical protein